MPNLLALFGGYAVVNLLALLGGLFIPNLRLPPLLRLGSVLKGTIKHEPRILEPPACVISRSRSIQLEVDVNGETSSTSDKRVIAIGDVHGSLEGLLEDLSRANITKEGVCEWRPQSDSVLLVQVGDIVDRGPQAIEAFKCMRHLQQTAHLYNGEVSQYIAKLRISLNQLILYEHLIQLLC
jgi:hypothetical protein